MKYMSNIVSIRQRTTSVDVKTPFWYLLVTGCVVPESTKFWLAATQMLQVVEKRWWVSMRLWCGKNVQIVWREVACTCDALKYPFNSSFRGISHLHCSCTIPDKGPHFRIGQNKIPFGIPIREVKLSWTKWAHFAEQNPIVDWQTCRPTSLILSSTVVAGPGYKMRAREMYLLCPLLSFWRFWNKNFVLFLISG